MQREMSQDFTPGGRPDFSAGPVEPKRADCVDCGGDFDRRLMRHYPADGWVCKPCSNGVPDEETIVNRERKQPKFGYAMGGTQDGADVRRLREEAMRDNPYYQRAARRWSR